MNLLKAIDAQDIVKATQLLVNSIDLVKERNRTIRIADSSDGGGLQLNITRIHVLNAVALDLDDDKRFRAAEREAISDRNRTRARRGQNAERLQNRLTSYSQPYGARGRFSAWTVSAWAVHNFNSPQTTTTTRFPQSCKRGLSFSAVHSGIGGQSVLSGSLALSPPSATSPTRLEQVPVHLPLHVNLSSPQFLDTLSSDVFRVAEHVSKESAYKQAVWSSSK
ncbi:hypothetical protein OS493_021754 [Desmophyllum pertusum]|uniref:Uncharacterized protein n=1 Tax=Desmophyllum pertusum TaxID=174260 RepID=A0A9X0A108_9CNID|nr:hypothetical protein OS493_021754 [Desmophyllum pertusum]